MNLKVGSNFYYICLWMIEQWLMTEIKNDPRYNTFPSMVDGNDFP
jgi:hypothetical protein